MIENKIVQNWTVLFHTKYSETFFIFEPHKRKFGGGKFGSQISVPQLYGNDCNEQTFALVNYRSPCKKYINKSFQFYRSA
ncbi:hypothetical protein ASG31_17740 [Chryseobacterium sp. Leaf404]|nr:hypothetical protein ASG31_17740 [Chryseobacterium sp. Leaf404]